MTSGTRSRRWPCVLASCALLVTSGAVHADPETASGLVPLPRLNLAKGDIEVRIHYLGSLLLDSRWLVLRRAGESSAGTTVKEGPSGEYPKSQRIIPSVPWPEIWAKLGDAQFFELPGSKALSTCEKYVPIDAENIYVEVKRGPIYRRYGYYAPTESKCVKARQFLEAINFLNAAFAHVFPIGGS